MLRRELQSRALNKFRGTEAWIPLFPAAQVFGTRKNKSAKGKFAQLGADLDFPQRQLRIELAHSPDSREKESQISGLITAGGFAEGKNRGTEFFRERMVQPKTDEDDGEKMERNFVRNDSFEN